MVNNCFVVEFHNSARAKPGLRFYVPFSDKRRLRRWPEALDGPSDKYKHYTIVNSDHFVEGELKFAINCYLCT